MTSSLYLNSQNKWVKQFQNHFSFLEKTIKSENLWNHIAKILKMIMDSFLLVLQLNISSKNVLYKSLLLLIVDKEIVF